MPYLPYEEAGITVILSLTSFLVLLNAVRYIFDRLLYCGIIGEILLGIIWGLPVGGTAWLSEGAQKTIQAFGYLGLIGLVFEGGLGIDLALLRKTVYMSVSVATIGLLAPIALSFLLLVFPFSSGTATAYPTPIAAFSAGASLCSTSLGTTFAILSSANIQRTRVGVVLVGAAMMDDVVGLVMVNIVTTLGDSESGAWPIARPIAASFGLLLVTLTISSLVLGPICRWLFNTFDSGTQLDSAAANSKSTFRNTITKLVHQIPHLGFILSTSVLIVFVTIASYIDASVLFAAFIAGGVVNFLWTIRNERHPTQSIANGNCTKMYEEYFKPVMDFVLVPFFFSSIGFSIPITEMFTASIVWKGIVYSILMILAKGLVSIVVYFDYFVKVFRKRKSIISQRAKKASPQSCSIYKSTQPVTLTTNPEPSQDVDIPSGAPHSVALIVGLAMISRGEIGFLIASLSQSAGTLTLRNPDESSVASSGEEIFLVIIWAVVLCTVAGPLGVGIVVRRLRAGNNDESWL